VAPVRCLVACSAVEGVEAVSLEISLSLRWLSVRGYLFAPAAARDAEGVSLDMLFLWWILERAYLFASLGVKGAVAVILDTSFRLPLVGSSNVGIRLHLWLPSTRRAYFLMQHFVLDPFLMVRSYLYNS